MTEYRTSNSVSNKMSSKRCGHSFNNAVANPFIKKPAYSMPIDADFIGQRLDNFLLGRLKGLPKSHVYRIIRKGEIRVNKGRVKNNYRLKIGDTVRIPPVYTQPKSISVIPSKAYSLLREQTLFEDSDFLIINKPSGLAVHGGSGLSFGLIELLRKSRADCNYLELAHRLDRETSGCLIIAKRRTIRRRFQAMFTEHKVAKRYISLLEGRLKQNTININLPLKKNNLQSGERMVRVCTEGKAAKTLIRPKQCYQKISATLVEIEPKTGRTHQIRVHAASTGHPVAGDDKYGNDAFNRQLRALGLKRLFLHAEAVSFLHPRSQQFIRVQAPVNAELEAVLNQL